MIHGLGVDIIEINRIERAVARWGDKFLEHVFNPDEIAYCKRNKKNPAQHYAVRFAAKEAVFKAIGDQPDLGWKDMTIKNDKYGKPYCLIHKAGFTRTIHLSLSHSKDYAVANALVTEK